MNQIQISIPLVLIVLLFEICCHKIQKIRKTAKKIPANLPHLRGKLPNGVSWQQTILYLDGSCNSYTTDDSTIVELALIDD